MPISRQTVLDQAQQWARQPARLRWSPVHFCQYEDDAVALWAFALDGRPLPEPVADTSVSCFSIFLLAMAHVSDMPLEHLRPYLRNLYTSSFKRTRELGDRLWQGLLAGSNPITAFDPRTGAVPEPGQLIFFNGSGHVLMANRIRDGSGQVDASRVEVLSFYGNYPKLPARTDVPTPLAVGTLGQIRDYFAMLQVYSQVSRGRSPTPARVQIEFADPFWA